jgi:hypothetical protein
VIGQVYQFSCCFFLSGYCIYVHPLLANAKEGGAPATKSSSVRISFPECQLMPG